MQAILFLHLGDKPANGLRQTFVAKDGRAQVDAQVTRQPKHFAKFLSDFSQVFLHGHIFFQLSVA